MKKIIFLILPFLITKALSQNPSFHWAKSFGSTGTDYGRAIVVDSPGNIYTFGNYFGTVDFDPGAGLYNLSSGTVQAAFITKFDPLGNFIWAKSIAGTGDVDAYSITLDPSGNIYTTGAFGGEADFNPGTGIYNISSTGIFNTFISKLDINGNFIWAKTFSSTANYNIGHSIVTDRKKNIYTTGYFYTATDFDPGPLSFTLATKAGARDIYVSKLDSSGNFIWAKALGGKGGAEGYSIAVDTAGYVYTTGYFKDTTDFDPGPGDYSLPGPNFFNVFINKLDPFGNFVWAKSLSALSSGGGSWGQSLTVDKIGNVYTTGFFGGILDIDPGPATSTISSFGGTQDIFINKLDGSGNPVWCKQLGGGGDDMPNSIVMDSSCNIYSTGTFKNTADFDPGPGIANFISAGNEDVYFNKLDSAGNFILTKCFGGTLRDFGLSLFIDSYKNVHITGVFNGTCDFDPDLPSFNLISSGNEDAFILKLGSTVGIKEYANKNAFLFPNPSSQSINIIDDEKIFENCEIEISNNYGQVIFKIPFSSTINISQIPSGFYNLKLTSRKNQIIVLKFVKE
jgi:hypothetical protein